MRLPLLASLLVVALAPSCGARTGLEVRAGCERSVEIVFVPTARAQIGVWASAGDHFATLALTDAVARRGLGNRPGASQLNSGYRWPYGRRVDVLPGWAGERLAAGEPGFPTVIFDDRSEGFVGQGGQQNSAEDYYCLSYIVRESDRDHLDMVSCASAFHGDKGRYLTDADARTSYGEPFETAPAVGGLRVLPLLSAYPPRRDISATPLDSSDVDRFARDALAAMPELDAVSMPTPPADVPVHVLWDGPPDWPAGTTTVSVEIHTEGDYNDVYGPDTQPTPTAPAGTWEEWSSYYGYPYRGQPSVLYDLPVEIPSRAEPHREDRSYTSGTPTRRGTWDARLATVAYDDTMTDDAVAHPGSGADRLRLQCLHSESFFCRFRSLKPILPNLSPC